MQVIVVAKWVWLNYINQAIKNVSVCLMNSLLNRRQIIYKKVWGTEEHANPMKSSDLNDN